MRLQTGKLPFTTFNLHHPFHLKPQRADSIPVKSVSREQKRKAEENLEGWNKCYHGSIRPRVYTGSLCEFEHRRRLTHNVQQEDSGGVFNCPGARRRNDYSQVNSPSAMVPERHSFIPKKSILSRSTFWKRCWRGLSRSWILTWRTAIMGSKSLIPQGWRRAPGTRLPSYFSKDGALSGWELYPFPPLSRHSERWRGH